MDLAMCKREEKKKSIRIYFLPFNHPNADVHAFTLHFIAFIVSIKAMARRLQTTIYPINETLRIFFIAIFSISTAVGIFDRLIWQNCSIYSGRIVMLISMEIIHLNFY